MFTASPSFRLPSVVTRSVSGIKYTVNESPCTSPTVRLMPSIAMKPFGRIYLTNLEGTCKAAAPVRQVSPAFDEVCQMLCACLLSVALHISLVSMCRYPVSQELT